MENSSQQATLQLALLPLPTDEECEDLRVEAEILRTRNENRALGLRRVLAELGLGDVNLADPEVMTEVVFELHHRMLETSLRLLRAGHTSPKTWQSIYNWVAEDLALSSAGIIARPFSFQACCAVLGLDAERLQQELLWLLRRDPRAPRIH